MSGTTGSIADMGNDGGGGCYCIILTGYPCCGKTTVANEIQKRALAIDATTRTIIISENVIASLSSSTSQDKTTRENDEVQIPSPQRSSIVSCYQSTELEKKLRGELKSNFDRITSSSSSLSKKTKTIVILDGTNYIKGYRYELYCIAKAAKCSYCIVWCLADSETVYEWNDLRRREDHDSSYSNELLKELILRYEPPDERNRWDKPLYKIHVAVTKKTTDDTHDDKQPEPCAQNSSKLSLDQQILSQSLYNMHNLADALQQQKSSTSTNQNNNNESTMISSYDQDISRLQPNCTATISMTQTNTTSMKDSKKKITASSTFKRAKKPAKKPSSSVSPSNEVVDVSLSTSSNNIPQPVFALTAEALEQHDLLHKQQAEVTSTTTTKSRNEVKNDNLPMPPPTIATKDHGRKSNDMIESSFLSLEEQIDTMLQSFLYTVKPLHEGISTRQHVATNSDVLHIVDHMTQQVCSAILKAQEEQEEEQRQGPKKNEQQQAETIETTTDSDPSSLWLSLMIDDDNKQTSKKEFKVKFQRSLLRNNATDKNYIRPKIYNANDLHQLRTQFIQWCIKNPPESTSKNIITLFLQYIEARQ